MNTAKITRLGLFLALGLILSYLETLIPINASVPGVKIGLANVITMYILYCYDAKDAWIIMILRVLISAILFSGLSTVIFGIFGGIMSIFVMLMAKKTDYLSVVGVSVLGALAHNVGQIIAAFIVMNSLGIIYYMPYLIITGVLFGAAIGYVTGLLIDRFNAGKL